MMGATGEPSGYYPMDSNGLMVQSELPMACVCQVALVPMVCPPLGYGGCEGGQCNEMPPILPPGIPPLLPLPYPPDTIIILHGTTDGLIIEEPFETILRWLFAPACAVLAREEGLESIAVCKKKHPKHSHCDKMGHCVAMCVATQCSSRILAWCLGWLRDPPIIGDPEDRTANWAGEQCGKHGGDCNSCCQSWWNHKYGPRPCPHCRFR